MTSTGNRRRLPVVRSSDFVLRLYRSTRRKCSRTGDDSLIGQRWPLGTPEGNAQWWAIADGIADHSDQQLQRELREVDRFEAASRKSKLMVGTQNNV